MEDKKQNNSQKERAQVLRSLIRCRQKNGYPTSIVSIAEEQLLTQQKKEREQRWIEYPNPGTRDSQEAAHVMNERHIAEIKALTGHM